MQFGHTLPGMRICTVVQRDSVISCLLVPSVQFWPRLPLVRRPKLFKFSPKPHLARFGQQEVQDGQSQTKFWPKPALPRSRYLTREVAAKAPTTRPRDVQRLSDICFLFLPCSHFRINFSVSASRIRQKLVRCGNTRPIFANFGSTLPTFGPSWPR